MPQDKKSVENDIDWEHRILCNDGNCIGVIGMDGRCKVCGKVFTGKLPENFGVKAEDETAVSLPDTATGESLLDSREAEDVPDNVDNRTNQDEENDDDDEADELEPDWEKRILCIDENCIGVIGPDGKCKECGKLYEEKK